LGKTSLVALGINLEGKIYIMKAKCPKCGARYYGWALENPLRRKCRKCGSTLEILDNDLPLMPLDQSPGILKIQDKLPEKHNK
jgi:rRNA maturation protein Nop10